MQKVLILSIVLFLLIAHQAAGQHQGTRTIEGEGDIVRQEITLPSFDGISLGFSGDVVLTQGNTQKVVLEGQQNILDIIKRDVKNGHWNISYDRNVRNAKKVTVYITVPTINDISLSGSGSVKSDGRFFGVGDLDISISGSGNITFDNTSRKTDLHISGSGKVYLHGSTGAMGISISGSGSVFAENYTASSCDVHISGSGNVQVKVNGDLKSTISGSGNVRYTGDASVTARVSGSGRVSKL